MKAYIDILNKIIFKGEWVENKRTGKRCKTIIDETISFNVGKGEFPILTTKKVFYKAAIGEMLGYLRGYTSTEQFHKLGVKTWDANAANPQWTESPEYELMLGSGSDLGFIYGAVGNHWPMLHPSLCWVTNPKEVSYITFKPHIPVLDNIIQSLKERDDNRGLIWSFWNPGMFHLGCLRPCMYEHQFSIVGDKLHLSSTMR